MNNLHIERIEEQYLYYDENLLICYKGKPYTGIGYYLFDDGLGVAYEVNYKNGFEHGVKRKWHRRGQLEFEYPMLRGMGYGRQRTWHPNGQLKKDVVCEYGIVLIEKLWDEHGNLIEEYQLVEDSTNYRVLLKFRELYKDLKP